MKRKYAFVLYTITVLCSMWVVACNCSCKTDAPPFVMRAYIHGTVISHFQSDEEDDKYGDVVDAPQNYLLVRDQLTQKAIWVHIKPYLYSLPNGFKINFILSADDLTGDHNVNNGTYDEMQEVISKNYARFHPVHLRK